MRSFFILFLFLPVLSWSQGETLVAFETKKKHLGVVSKGSKVSDEFVFTNISGEPLEIDLVSTCDCTIAKWSKGKIMPGKKGYIRFIFDSNKKEEEEPVDVDVFFKNLDPKTGNPLTIFLSYSFTYEK